MFERFTKDARQAVTLAQEEARRLHHAHIGTEHILLSLLATGDKSGAEALRACGMEITDLRARVMRYVGSGEEGLDPEALAAIGIDLDQVRRATEASFGEGALAPKSRRRPTGHIPFTSRAKKVLELSLREALLLKHNHISPGHILLGLIREGDGLACTVLVDAGADLKDLRADVIRRISAEAA
jgi:ATP-dependent Clp protease ATP-binding subunit ClpA